jgi:hypothetical protein
VAIVQAILSSVVALGMYNRTCSIGKDILKPQLVYTERYTWFACGYFVHDIYGMYRTWTSKLFDQEKFDEIDKNTEFAGLYSKIPSFRKGDLKLFKSYSCKNHEIPSFIRYLSKEPLMICHHLICSVYAIFAIPLFRQNFGDCIVSLLYLMEISTPFVNLRAILSMMNYKDTKIYLINGVLMILSFFVCRVFLLIFVVYLYGSLKGDYSVIQTYWNLPLNCQIPLAIMFGMQFYWFYLMVRKVYKIIGNESSYQ